MAESPMITREQYRKHFLTEQSCYDYLYRMKWPDGYRCPKCLNGARYEIATRHYPIYECTKCGYQTTLTAGTILEKTRTEVTLWFAAIYMAVQDGGASTASVANELDISYQSAWAMMRKIRGALASPACVANAPKLSED